MFKKHKAWMCYGLYTAVVLIFFLYHLFPSKTIEANVISVFHQVHPGTALTIERISPVFPPGIKASGVVFGQGDPLQISLEQLRITPEIRTLFGSSPAFAIFGLCYDGHVKGRMILDRNGELTALHTDLAEIQIGRMAAVEHLSRTPVDGTLSGLIDFERSDAAGQFTASLTASTCRMDIEIPGASLKDLTFAEVNAKLAADDAATLRIEALSAKGSQINGNLSGTIRIKTPYPESGLDLVGSIKPHPSFISGLDSSISILFQNRGGNNTFPFIIKGTIASPEFLLQ
ncbi:MULTISPECIES: type II secretion system protein GspN [Desulfococcus]|jgi:type II secretion system protein N|uniref:Type II secretion system protein GspN n=1 Tax=Desulfococcus multivorans DSM 2059 TaxID=1121405 RepID=S7TQW4_DESML|nr:type II secretion system protein GspN [Desulfococcus multivorans]AOY57966.1 uncharacterized protein Dmul_11910 [Desulfococcus multivorans]AQV00334.1 type II secretion system protein GspN [Desulfococcus multivorans]EPR39050.1 hypothetical protein dsmv_0460 [Desulfococcus multivorans DSM 2059]MDX9818480.1 type II secretion system protein GspN [Desulfococcus multivorans]SJZ64176.1 type II secretion system protein N [Desulfococcus multivorans DSM 2059]